MTRLHDNELINGKLEAVARRSNVLKGVFAVILAAYVVLAAVVWVLMGIGEGGFFSDGAYLLAKGVPLLISLIIGACILAVIMLMFKDLSQRKSPFTDKQARRIALIGVLLLADAVLELLVSLGGPAVVSSQAVEAGVVSPYMAGGIYLNMTFVIAALICFCLSYVFRYGSLLQWLADETI